MARYDAITQAVIDMFSAPLGDRAEEREVLRSLIEARHPGAIARAKQRRKQADFDAKFSKKTPAWAKRLAAKYAPRIGAVRWHVSDVGTFHGTCYSYNEISVTTYPGNDVAEERILLLHELAHARDPYGRHGPGFYDTWAKYLKAENLYRKAVSGQWPGASSLKAASRRARASGDS